MKITRWEGEHPDPREFWDTLGNKLLAGHLHRRMYVHERQMERFKTIIQMAEGIEGDDLSCLEIGCCEGLMTNVLRRMFDRVVAVDVSPVLIEHCPPLPNVEYLCRDVDDWIPMDDYPDTIFDCVILSEVVEHLRNPVDVIKRLSGIARFLIVSSPVGSDRLTDRTWDHSLYGEGQTQVGDATGHLWTWDMDGFKSLFGSCPILRLERPAIYAVALIGGEWRDTR
jgi:hypothetical protein